MRAGSAQALGYIYEPENNWKNIQPARQSPTVEERKKVVEALLNQLLDERYPISWGSTVAGYVGEALARMRVTDEAIKFLNTKQQDPGIKDKRPIFRALQQVEEGAAVMSRERALRNLPARLAEPDTDDYQYELKGRQIIVKFGERSRDQFSAQYEVYVDQVDGAHKLGDFIFRFLGSRNELVVHSGVWQTASGLDDDFSRRARVDLERLANSHFFGFYPLSRGMRNIGATSLGTDAQVARRLAAERPTAGSTRRSALSGFAPRRDETAEAQAAWDVLNPLVGRGLQVQLIRENAPHTPRWTVKLLRSLKGQITDQQFHKQVLVPMMKQRGTGFHFMRQTHTDDGRMLLFLSSDSDVMAEKLRSLAVETTDEKDGPKTGAKPAEVKFAEAFQRREERLREQAFERRAREYGDTGYDYEPLGQSSSSAWQPGSWDQPEPGRHDERPATPIVRDAQPALSADEQRSRHRAQVIGLGNSLYEPGRVSVSEKPVTRFVEVRNIADALALKLRRMPHGLIELHDGRLINAKDIELRAPSPTARGGQYSVAYVSSGGRGTETSLGQIKSITPIIKSAGARLSKASSAVLEDERPVVRRSGKSVPDGERLWKSILAGDPGVPMASVEDHGTFTLGEYLSVDGIYIVRPSAALSQARPLLNLDQPFYVVFNRLRYYSPDSRAPISRVRYVKLSPEETLSVAEYLSQRPDRFQWPITRIDSAEPTKAQIARDFWPAFYKNMDTTSPRHARFNRVYQPLFIDAAVAAVDRWVKEGKKEFRILQDGAGDGRVLRLLQSRLTERYPQVKFQFIGVDLNAEAIGSQTNEPSLKIIAGRAQDESRTASYAPYDLILDYGLLVKNVMSERAEAQAVLDKWTRQLRPGGLVLSLPFLYTTWFEALNDTTQREELRFPKNWRVVARTVPESFFRRDFPLSDLFLIFQDKGGPSFTADELLSGPIRRALERLDNEKEGTRLADTDDYNKAIALYDAFVTATKAQSFLSGLPFQGLDRSQFAGSDDEYRAAMAKMNPDFNAAAPQHFQAMSHFERLLEQTADLDALNMVLESVRASLVDAYAMRKPAGSPQTKETFYESYYVKLLSRKEELTGRQPGSFQINLIWGLDAIRGKIDWESAPESALKATDLTMELEGRTYTAGEAFKQIETVRFADIEPYMALLTFENKDTVLDFGPNLLDLAIGPKKLLIKMVKTLDIWGANATEGRFDELGEFIFGRLAASARMKSYKAGEEIIHQNDPGKEVYIVNEGEVRVEKGGVPVATLKAGQHFGEIAGQRTVSRTASVIAVTDTTVLVLDSLLFFEILSFSPVIRGVVNAEVDRRMAEGARLVKQHAEPSALNVKSSARLAWDHAVETFEAETQGTLWRKENLLEFLREWPRALETAKRAGTLFVPRAAVEQEARMGLTPAGVRFLKNLGLSNPIVVESGAGVNRETGQEYFSDDNYRKAGAEVVDHETFLRRAGDDTRKVVVSIKEPQPSEYPLLKNALLFTYLHLSDPKADVLVKALTQRVWQAVAYETIAVREPNGLVKTPVLAPASQAAGWLSAIRIAVHMKHQREGRLADEALSEIYRTQSQLPLASDWKTLLAGKKTVVLGGGVAGSAAAAALAQMGADVVITEIDERRIEELRNEFTAQGVNVRIVQRPRDGISDEIIQALESANAIVGAILIPGATAPVEINKTLYERLVKNGNLQMIADIAIDQGGNFEISKPQKYRDGWVVNADGVAQFSVTNMPSAIPVQVSRMLDEAKLAYLVALMAISDATGDARAVGHVLKFFPELIEGFNIADGMVIHPRVAEKHGAGLTKARIYESLFNLDAWSVENLIAALKGRRWEEAESGELQKHLARAGVRDALELELFTHHLRQENARDPEKGISRVLQARQEELNEEFSRKVLPDAATLASDLSALATGSHDRVWRSWLRDRAQRLIDALNQDPQLDTRLHAWDLVRWDRLMMQFRAAMLSPSQFSDAVVETTDSFFTVLSNINNFEDLDKRSEILKRGNSFFAPMIEAGRRPEGSRLGQRLHVNLELERTIHSQSYGLVHYIPVDDERLKEILTDDIEMTEAVDAVIDFGTVLLSDSSPALFFIFNRRPVFIFYTDGHTVSPGYLEQVTEAYVNAMIALGVYDPTVLEPAQSASSKSKAELDRGQALFVTSRRPLASRLAEAPAQLLVDRLRQHPSTRVGAQAALKDAEAGIAYLTGIGVEDETVSRPEWIPVAQPLVQDAGTLRALGNGVRAVWAEKGWEGNPGAYLSLIPQKRILPSFYRFQKIVDQLLSKVPGDRRLSLWAQGVALVSHLEYEGTHEGQDASGRDILIDNELLTDVVRELIPLVLSLTEEESARALPVSPGYEGDQSYNTRDLLLWGLTVMLDPLLHDTDLGQVETLVDDQPWAQGAEKSMEYFLKRMLTGLEYADGKPVDDKDVQRLLLEILSVSEQQWLAKGYRSPRLFVMKNIIASLQAATEAAEPQALADKILLAALSEDIQPYFKRANISADLKAPAAQNLKADNPYSLRKWLTREPFATLFPDVKPFLDAEPLVAEEVLDETVAASRLAIQRGEPDAVNLKRGARLVKQHAEPDAPGLFVTGARLVTVAMVKALAQQIHATLEMTREPSAEAQLRKSEALFKQIIEAASAKESKPKDRMFKMLSLLLEATVELRAAYFAVPEDKSLTRDLIRQRLNHIQTVSFQILDEESLKLLTLILAVNKGKETNKTWLVGLTQQALIHFNQHGLSGPDYFETIAEAAHQEYMAVPFIARETAFAVAYLLWVRQNDGQLNRAHFSNYVTGRVEFLKLHFEQIEEDKTLTENVRGAGAEDKPLPLIEKATLILLNALPTAASRLTLHERLKQAIEEASAAQALVQAAYQDRSFNSDKDTLLSLGGSLQRLVEDLRRHAENPESANLTAVARYVEGINQVFTYLDSNRNLAFENRFGKFSQQGPQARVHMENLRRLLAAAEVYPVQPASAGVSVLPFSASDSAGHAVDWQTFDLHGPDHPFASRLAKQRGEPDAPGFFVTGARLAEQPITAIAEKAGLLRDEVQVFETINSAKILFDKVQARLKGAPDAKVILITAINPRKAGEGKTTTAIGLVQGLGYIGRDAIVVLREPSLGPFVGQKGGATGTGRATLEPSNEINWQFTGDIPAVEWATNQLAAAIDNHIRRGNRLDLDLQRITWPRAVDISDSSLRDVLLSVEGAGKTALSFERKTRWVITAASEVMAILALAKNQRDLRTRLDRIIVGYAKDGKPVTAEQLNSAGVMAVALRHAIKPNLVQTQEGQPALIHAGPFANVAHGNSSVIAMNTARKLAGLAGYVVTEAGFGADLGAEKFFDIVARQEGITPSLSVLVVTAQALKLNGGLSEKELKQDLTAEQSEAALRRGFANLDRHVSNLRGFGVPVLIAINRFPKDSDAEIDLIRQHAAGLGVRAEISEAVTRGGEGAAALATAATEIIETETNTFKPLYGLDLSIRDKIGQLAAYYGADGVDLEAQAETDIRQLEEAQGAGFFAPLGLDVTKLPVNVAKTQFSFSHNPKLLGAPTGWRLKVASVKLSAGAGFLVVQSDGINLLPGLAEHPAAEGIDIEPQAGVRLAEKELKVPRPPQSEVFLGHPQGEQLLKRLLKRGETGLIRYYSSIEENPPRPQTIRVEHKRDGDIDIQLPGLEKLGGHKNFVVEKDGSITYFKWIFGEHQSVASATDKMRRTQNLDEFFSATERGGAEPGSKTRALGTRLTEDQRALFSQAAKIRLGIYATRSEQLPALSNFNYHAFALFFVSAFVAVSAFYMAQLSTKIAGPLKWLTFLTAVPGAVIFYFKVIKPFVAAAGVMKYYRGRIGDALEKLADVHAKLGEPTAVKGQDYNAYAHQVGVVLRLVGLSDDGVLQQAAQFEAALRTTPPANKAAELLEEIEGEIWKLEDHTLAFLAKPGETARDLVSQDVAAVKGLMHDFVEETNSQLQQLPVLFGGQDKGSRLAVVTPAAVRENLRLATEKLEAGLQAVRTGEDVMKVQQNALGQTVAANLASVSQLIPSSRIYSLNHENNIDRPLALAKTAVSVLERLIEITPEKNLIARGDFDESLKALRQVVASLEQVKTPRTPAGFALNFKYRSADGKLSLRAGTEGYALSYPSIRSATALLMRFGIHAEESYRRLAPYAHWAHFITVRIGKDKFEVPLGIAWLADLQLRRALSGEVKAHIDLLARALPLIEDAEALKWMSLVQLSGPHSPTYVHPKDAELLAEVAGLLGIVSYGRPLQEVNGDVKELLLRLPRLSDLKAAAPPAPSRLADPGQLEALINEALNANDVGAAVKLLTENHHEFSPEELLTIAKKIREAYQGPIKIVGKVGGSTISFEAATADGLLGYRVTVKTNRKGDDEAAVVRRISEAILEVMKFYGSADRVLSVYFATPGFFDHDGRLQEAEENIPGLNRIGFSFEESIGKYINAHAQRHASLGAVPITVVHDGTGGAFGETSVYGTLPDRTDADLLFVIAGTGVGTRRLVRGKPYLGDARVRFLINEMPHTLLFNGNPAAPDFTNIGLETKGGPQFTDKMLADHKTLNPLYRGPDMEDRTGGPGIEAYGREEIQRILSNGQSEEHDAAQALISRVDGDVDKIDTKILGAAVHEETPNPLALRIIQERGRELGIGLAVLIIEYQNVFGVAPPEYVIIGSGVSQIGAPYLDAVREGAKRRFAAAGVAFDVDNRFIPSKIKDDTARELFGGLPSQADIRAYTQKLGKIAATRLVKQHAEPGAPVTNKPGTRLAERPPAYEYRQVFPLPGLKIQFDGVEYTLKAPRSSGANSFSDLISQLAIGFSNFQYNQTAIRITLQDSKGKHRLFSATDEGVRDLAQFLDKSKTDADLSATAAPASGAPVEIRLASVWKTFKLDLVAMGYHAQSQTKTLRRYRPEGYEYDIEQSVELIASNQLRFELVYHAPTPFRNTLIIDESAQNLQLNAQFPRALERIVAGKIQKLKINENKTAIEISLGPETVAAIHAEFPADENAFYPVRFLPAASRLASVQSLYRSIRKAFGKTLSVDSESSIGHTLRDLRSETGTSGVRKLEFRPQSHILRLQYRHPSHKNRREYVDVQFKETESLYLVTATGQEGFKSYSYLKDKDAHYVRFGFIGPVFHLVFDKAFVDHYRKTMPANHFLLFEQLVIADSGDPRLAQLKDDPAAVPAPAAIQTASTADSGASEGKQAEDETTASASSGVAPENAEALARRKRELGKIKSWLQGIDPARRELLIRFMHEMITADAAKDAELKKKATLLTLISRSLQSSQVSLFRLGLRPEGQREFYDFIKPIFSDDELRAVIERKFSEIPPPAAAGSKSLLVVNTDTAALKEIERRLKGDFKGVEVITANSHKTMHQLLVGNPKGFTVLLPAEFGASAASSITRQYAQAHVVMYASEVSELKEARRDLGSLLEIVDLVEQRFIVTKLTELGYRSAAPARLSEASATAEDTQTIARRIVAGISDTLIAYSPVNVPVALAAPQEAVLEVKALRLPTNQIVIERKVTTLAEIALKREGSPLPELRSDRRELLLVLREADRFNKDVSPLPTRIIQTVASSAVFDARALVQAAKEDNALLARLAAWGSGAVRFWNTVHRNFIAEVAGTPGSVTPLVLPYIADSEDLRQTLRVLNALSASRDVRFLVLLAHTGAPLSPEALEGISQAGAGYKNIQVAALHLAPG